MEEECSRGELFVTHTPRMQRVKLDCCIAFPSRGKIPNVLKGGAGEMALQLQALAALAENWALVPRTHVAVNNHL